MSKTYEGLTVRQAGWKIEEDEASARRLFKRYVDTARKRAKTFEKKGLTSSWGYRRLRESLEEARYGFSAESLSHISFTLASEHTSYQKQKEIIKKTVETLNVEFGTYDESGTLIKPFITMERYGQFVEMMELLKTVLVYDPSELIAKHSAAFVETVASKGLDFDEEMDKLKRAIDAANEKQANFSMKRYMSALNRRKGRK